LFPALTKKAGKGQTPAGLVCLQKTCGCSKTSAFGTASIDLEEKPGFDRFFQELVPKLG
jgi:hypothetical protein